MRSTLAILPDELIIFKILVRLPARSLLQFRSVCTSWKALISSSQFAKDHIECSIADPTMTHKGLAYQANSETVCKLGICSIQPLLENPSTPTKAVCSTIGSSHQEIIGHCNGLLCFHNVIHRTLRLFNPCTGFASQWLQFEAPRVNDHFGYVICSGFGYDHVHDKYKLLFVFGGCRPFVTKVCTYGANSTWTTIQNSPARPDPVHNYSKFVSGTLNWVAQEPWVILSFDLGKETYGQVSLPRDMDHDYDHGRHDSFPELQVLRNCLCVCAFQKGTRCWVMWLMKEYGVEQSWTKLVMISPTIPSYPPLEPMHVSENGIVLAWQCDARLIVCNTNNDQVDYPILIDNSRSVFHIYHESLVSPSHFGLPSYHISKSVIA